MTHIRPRRRTSAKSSTARSAPTTPAAVAPEILSATNTTGDAGGTVGATRSLTLGGAGGGASFGQFTPGVTKTYESATTANVISTAGDATLSVADPSPTATGHLVNGAFSLPQPLKAGGSNLPATVKTYNGPVSNDAVTLGFQQAVGANDAQAGVILDAAQALAGADRCVINGRRRR